MNTHEQNLDPWYVTGICEGEGTFTYSRASNSIALYFAVKLTKSDQGLLYNIQDFFGVGKTYKVKPLAPSRYGGYTKSALYYRIARLSHLEIIIKHFDNYPLQGEKLKRYKIWKELVSLKKKNFKLSRWPKEDQNRFHELIQELSSLAPKNIPWDGNITKASNPQQ